MHMTMYFCRLAICSFATVVLCAANAVVAQRTEDYPLKPIRAIVPFAPGGPPDVIGRPVLAKLSQVLGQPILFDNRPGAAGAIGSEIVAKSPKDGYTILYTTGSHNTNTLMYRKLPYDAHRDFPPITQISRSYGQIMIVHPSLPVKTARRSDIEPTLARLKKDGVSGLVVPLDGFINRHRHEFARIVERLRLPAIYSVREFVEAGGLMSYGPSWPDIRRRPAEYVDRILKSAKPSDLPVQQPTRFELAVNIKSAKAIGLTFPPAIMVRAEHVVQ